MERMLIKRHADVLTVPEASKELAEEYRRSGYEVECLPGGCKLMLSDGIVMVYWSNGCFWAECISDVDLAC